MLVKTFSHLTLSIVGFLVFGLIALVGQATAAGTCALSTNVGNHHNSQTSLPFTRFPKTVELLGTTVALQIISSSIQGFKLTYTLSSKYHTCYSQVFVGSTAITPALRVPIHDSCSYTDTGLIPSQYLSRQKIVLVRCATG